MSSNQPIRIEPWKPDFAALDHDIEMLGDVLHACVVAGASVSFVLPFSHDDAKAFWSGQVLPAVVSQSRCVLVARTGPKIVATVQLDFATPPNQPHRADVKKLLVHPDARRRGIAKSLMSALEVQARKARRSLLTLDAVTAGTAEQLYISLGYVAIGTIPRYALNFNSSVLEATTVMYKELF
jgi:ribosomal protein S18 acetylase RimI-like enzyme